MSTDTTTEKIITEMPIETLWGGDGAEGLLRGICLNREDIRGLLRQGAVQFIVANCGLPPEWISSEQCFDFWKAEVQAHLVDEGEDSFDLEEFPDEYAYIATLWSASGIKPVVLLEMHH